MGNGLVLVAIGPPDGCGSEDAAAVGGVLVAAQQGQWVVVATAGAEV